MTLRPPITPVPLLTSSTGALIPRVQPLVSVSDSDMPPGPISSMPPPFTDGNDALLPPGNGSLRLGSLDDLRQQMRPANYAMGIELDERGISLGAVDDNGHVIARRLVPYGSWRDEERIAQQIAAEVRRLRDDIAGEKTELELFGIGCGVAGRVDVQDGVVMESPRFPEWRDASLRLRLTELLELPTVVDQDVHFHALGESLFGAGRGIDHFVLLRLGKEVSAGILINGQPFHGDFGLAGNIGHLVVEEGGAMCACGQQGCLEAYLSLHAFPHLLPTLKENEQQELGELIPGDQKFDIEQVNALHTRGSIAAAAMWRAYGRYLGRGIASILNTLGITTFIIGDPMSDQFERIYDPTYAACARLMSEEVFERLEILDAELGKDAGLIGAASAAFTGPIL